VQNWDVALVGDRDTSSKALTRINAFLGESNGNSSVQVIDAICFMKIGQVFELIKTTKTRAQDGKAPRHTTADAQCYALPALPVVASGKLMPHGCIIGCKCQAGTMDSIIKPGHVYHNVPIMNDNAIP